jgi:hypothetical protein
MGCMIVRMMNRMTFFLSTVASRTSSALKAASDEDRVARI